jgi:hypothetical protein
MRSNASFLKSVLLILSLAGCTVTLKVSPLTTFPATDTKIANSIVLYISPETRQYVLSDGAGIGVFKIPLGLILGESAKNSLQSVFQEVVRTESPASSGNNSPILRLQFTEGTSLNAGATTVSKSTVRISLKAILVGKAGEEIWSTVVAADTAEGSNVGFVSNFFGGIGGAIGESGYEGAMKSACQQALGLALLKLNNELITNKDIFNKF